MTIRFEHKIKGGLPVIIEVTDYQPGSPGSFDEPPESEWVETRILWKSGKEITGDVYYSIPQEDIDDIENAAIDAVKKDQAEYECEAALERYEDRRYYG